MTQDSKPLRECDWAAKHPPDPCGIASFGTLQGTHVLGVTPSDPWESEKRDVLNLVLWVRKENLNDIVSAFCLDNDIGVRD